MAKTLFEHYGGFTAVRRIVADLYDGILDSEQLSGYFEGTDMRLMIDHQTKFIAQLMGGPASYSDEALQRLHAAHSIKSPAFDEMAVLLKQTLQDHGVSSGDVADISNQIYRRKHYIVAADSDS